MTKLYFGSNMLLKCPKSLPLNTFIYYCLCSDSNLTFDIANISSNLHKYQLMPESSVLCDYLNNRKRCGLVIFI